jgi:hypothetical protein
MWRGVEIALKVVGGVEVYSLFFTMAVDGISQTRTPAVLPLGKDPSEYREGH